MSRFTFFAERPVTSYRKADTALVVMILLLWGIGLEPLFS